MTGHEDIPALQADFRAAVIQAIAGSADHPEHPQTAEQVKYLEEEYAIHLEQTGIYISGKNDIPGFKQVVFLGQGLSYTGLRGWYGYFGVIAITTDDQLVTGSIKHRNPNNKKPVTTVQAIKALVGLHQSEQEFVNDSFHFYLDDKINDLNVTDSLGSFNSYVNYSCRLESDTRTEIKRFLLQQTWDRLSPVRCAVLAALDKTILHDLQKYNFSNISAGRWLTGGDGVTEDVILARQQAARAYPLLAGMFEKK